MTPHQEYIKKIMEHVANGGTFIFNRARRQGKTMESIKRRLEAQVIDKIEQQVQHCFRSYENDLLEDKLIELVREWFFKGFFGGREHIQLKQEQQQGEKQ